MKQLPLCLTVVISFSLLNVACTDETAQCQNLYNHEQYSEAFPFCQEACNLNNGLGCSNLGLVYSNGQGVRQNYQTAKEYYGKACNLGAVYN